MHFKRTKKRLLIWTSFALAGLVSIALFLQVNLSRTIATLDAEISNPASSLHQASESVVDANARIDAVRSKSSPSILDILLFRRTIDFNYNLTTIMMRREIAHSKIPASRRVDESYVDVPVESQTRKSLRVLAKPFGYEIEH